VPRRTPTLDIATVMVALQGDRTGPTDQATEAMLDATSTLLATYGVRRWSMDDVAERSGLARATVYRRFEGRDELVAAALARDARRFFAAIAEAVAHTESIEDKVVEGFLVALRVVQASVLPTLIDHDGGAALSILTDGASVALGRAALVDRYEALLGQRLEDSERAEAEVVAETVIRIGISFVLIPDSVIDLADDGEARQAVGRLLRPLLRRRS